MELGALIHFLGEILGQVIGEIESPKLFTTEEKIRALAKSRRAGDASAAAQLADAVRALDPRDARGVASAFTLYFDLVNIAEDAERPRVLRQREREQHPAPVPESIADAMAILKQRGMPAAQLARLIQNLRIELVITAHPTESKRRSALSKQRRLAEIIPHFYDADLLPRERDEFTRALAAEITSLWLTDRARTGRPSVHDEARTGLYFVEEIFWDALPRLYADLDAALAQYYPEISAPRAWLSLASWIGGDRDGNPNVTTPATAETLRLHRGLAVEQHRRAFQDLSRELSLSGKRLPPPAELDAWLDTRRPFPPHAAYLEKRYADEPYRLALSLLVADLETASQQDMTARLLEQTPHTARVQTAELARVLAWIEQALPPRLARDRFQTARRQLEIFGLHAARLDLREESARLTRALGEILRALKLDLDFEQQDAGARAQVLLKLFSENPERPAALADNPGVTAETAETWSLFKLIARAQAVYGAELLGPFIISMAHAPADVLTVLLLARWAGCANGLPIAPLFETLDDLDAAPRILRELFASAPYRAHLQTCGDAQMIMIGYSDSNKDGGYLAANWALYQAQENVAAECRARGIAFTLFHGRGGTIARGGGPVTRAIRAQAAGTINGRFRFTEQGEMLASRYSNPELAHRHLEQIASAVLLASFPNASEGARLEWRARMDWIAASARAEYRALVYETPGFADFWRGATPIDEIRNLMIGSRPVSRGGDALEIAHLRAIPWVFSWMQARFNLPGWYALGAALEPALDADIGEMRAMYREWNFFRALIDNAALALLQADMDIAAQYAALVADERLATRIFARIRAEYDRTRRALIAITEQSDLLDGEPVIQNSIRLRNPYVDPLNYIQIEMLRRARAARDDQETRVLREVIQITINGIAAGLRNTG